MAKIKPLQRTRKPPAVPRRQPVPRQSHTSSAGVVVGMLGWFCVVLAMVIALAAIRHNRSELARVSATLPRALQDLQEEVDRREQDVSESKKTLETQINDTITAQEKLIPEIAGLKLGISELEPRIEPLEHEKAKVCQGVEALEEDTELTDESATEIRARLAELENRKLKIQVEYRRRYRRLEAAFEERRSREEPEFLRQFYSANRHTPFAPAACFLTAERLYQKKRSADARRAYEKLVRSYPDSPYTTQAKTRLQQIEARARYEEPDTPFEFLPYRALPCVTDEAE